MTHVGGTKLGPYVITREIGTLHGSDLATPPHPAAGNAGVGAMVILLLAAGVFVISRRLRLSRSVDNPSRPVSARFCSAARAFHDTYDLYVPA